jgi:hypothetical protein
MGQPIPAQHPSVVLRSHFKLVRGLLAIAMVAVVALAAVVVILANDDNQVSTGATSAKPIESINYGDFNPATGKPDAVQQQSQTQPGTRYDGGPDEGTRGLNVQSQATPTTTRFDGGPEEGTRGAKPAAQPSYDASAYRSSYQPAPADGFKDRAGGPRMIPNGPGSR